MAINNGAVGGTLREVLLGGGGIYFLLFFIGILLNKGFIFFLPPLSTFFLG